MLALLRLCAHLIGRCLTMHALLGGTTPTVLLHCIKFTPQSKTGPQTRRRPLIRPAGVSTRSGGNVASNGAPNRIRTPRRRSRQMKDSEVRGDVGGNGAPRSLTRTSLRRDSPKFPAKHFLPVVGARFERSATHFLRKSDGKSGLCEVWVRRIVSARSREFARPSREFWLAWMGKSLLQSL